VSRLRDVARSTSEAVVPTYGLSARVTRLDVAVHENADLAVPLTAQVGRLESDLVPLLERRVAHRQAAAGRDGEKRG
jgi:hypothetical protein